jgi:hypothetical protein
LERYFLDFAASAFQLMISLLKNSGEKQCNRVFVVAIQSSKQRPDLDSDSDLFRDFTPRSH